MNDIQKKIYIDKEKNKQMKKNKQIVCTYNNERSKDYTAVIQYYQI